MKTESRCPNPNCRSTRFKKNGHAVSWKKGQRHLKQLYLCNNCGRQWVQR